MTHIGPTTGSLVDGTQSAQSQASLDDELNRFMNLLVTQLKNQDPLDPMDANEFTSQLVQFASVEQQIFQNSNLEKLLDLQETDQISQMVNYIGTQVEVLSQQLPLENGEAEFNYILGDGVTNATITILDSTGRNVFTADGDTSAGKHNIKWDGKNSSGQQLSDGTFTVQVNAQNAQGELQSVEHTVLGTVTGAGADDGNVFLFLGNNLTIDQTNVLSVKKPTTAATAATP